MITVSPYASTPLQLSFINKSLPLMTSSYVGGGAVAAVGGGIVVLTAGGGGAVGSGEIRASLAEGSAGVCDLWV